MSEQPRNLQQREEEEQKRQTLVDHLTELRKRLIHSLISIGVGFVVCWSFSDQIFDIIRRPIAPYLPTHGLVFTAPMEKFMAHVKVSFLAGFIIAAPFWLHQIWKFISPGLYRKERRAGILFIFCGSFLFLLGICFVYFLVYPMAFKFLMHFGGKTDQPMITINEYLSFFSTTTLLFGAAFEMPLVLTILGMLGIIDAKFLSSKRRYAIVILAGLSAVLTPPDIVSMTLMLVPMLGLYEASVILVRIFGQKPVQP